MRKARIAVCVAVTCLLLTALTFFAPRQNSNGCGCAVCRLAARESAAAPSLVKSDASLAPHPHWEGSPILVPEVKAVYCSIPKNACTQFKRFILRLQASSRWNSTAHLNAIHNPKSNGFAFIKNLNVTKANAIMHDPTWTRIVVVRDPVERFASAYLDKCVRKYPGPRNGTEVTGDDEHCPVKNVAQRGNVSALLDVLQQQVGAVKVDWKSGLAASYGGHHALNVHFIPQSLFCDMRMFAKAYVALDHSRLFEDAQCLFEKISPPLLRRDIKHTAAEVFNTKSSLIRHKTRARDVALQWRAQHAACLAKQSNCSTTVLARLYDLYHVDFQHSWNFLGGTRRFPGIVNAI